MSHYNTVFYELLKLVPRHEEVFPWAKFRKTKGAIKLHTLFDHSGYFPSVVVTDGKTHDAKLAQELPPDTFQADSILRPAGQ